MFSDFLSFYIFISRVCVVYWWRPIYDLTVYTVHNIYTCSFHMYRNIIAIVFGLLFIISCIDFDEMSL